MQDIYIKISRYYLPSRQALRDETQRCISGNQVPNEELLSSEGTGPVYPATRYTKLTFCCWVGPTRQSNRKIPHVVRGLNGRPLQRITDTGGALMWANIFAAEDSTKYIQKCNFYCQACSSRNIHWGAGCRVNKYFHILDDKVINIPQLYRPI